MKNEAIEKLAGAGRVHRLSLESGWPSKGPQAASPLTPAIAQPDVLLELIEVRRLFEPAATALAATRITDDDLLDIAAQCEAMRAARDDLAMFESRDIAFHHLVAAVTSNETLVSLLSEVAAQTIDARVRHGHLDQNAVDTAIAEHAAIRDALASRDPALAHAAALTHVHSTEKWLHRHLPHPAEPTPG